MVLRAEVLKVGKRFIRLGLRRFVHGLSAALLVLALRGVGALFFGSLGTRVHALRVLGRGGIKVELQIQSHRLKSISKPESSC